MWISKIIPAGCYSSCHHAAAIHYKQDPSLAPHDQNPLHPPPPSSSTTLHSGLCFPPPLCPWSLLQMRNPPLRLPPPPPPQLNLTNWPFALCSQSSDFTANTMNELTT